MAKFTWVAQFIFAPEDDPCTWMLLVMFDEEVMRLLLEEGFAVQFVDSLPDNVTVPHTSDKLAGTTVHMTVDFTFTPDGKALLLSNGSKSVNSTIPSPYSRLSKDTLMHPDYACAKYHTSYEERMADYQALKFFKQERYDEHEVEKCDACLQCFVVLCFMWEKMMWALEFFLRSL